MSTQRIGGKDFHINVGDTLIHVESISIQITDNRAVTKTRGVPNGWVDGDVDANGEMELDSQNFDLLIAEARKAGSFKQIAPFDVQFYANAGGSEKNVEAFGCMPKVTDLLNIDPTGKDKMKHKVTFDVTSPDFVRVDGVPYLADDETSDLLN